MENLDGSVRSEYQGLVLTYLDLLQTDEKSVGSVHKQGMCI